MRATFLVLAAAALTGAACRGRAATPADVAPAVETGPQTVVIPPDSPMLARIRREPIRMAELPTDEVMAPGKIEANPNRISKVLLPVTGRVASVLVRLGDAVAKDQPLLTLESPDADGAVSTFLSADAATTQAEAALTKAQADNDRANDLFRHDAVAQKDVLAAGNGLAQAKAALSQAEAAREQARRRLTVLGLSPGGFRQQVVVRSPLGGKVLELSVVPGEYRNDTTTPVATVADLGVVFVTSQVPENEIRFIRTGERVEIRLVAFPDQVFDGRVSRIADTLDPQTRTVKVQAQLANPDGRFRPEMYGSIRHIEAVTSAAVVPVGAVVENNDGRTMVFVERAPGRFELREISVGRREGGVLRVVRGVVAGDIVVVDGAMLLKGLVARS